ncbi:MAG: NAD(P)-dependent oxidoreductase [Cytophagales bacterium]|nr:NAD(P)-dependent oxidoreductase [Cytophagales bacterium]
MRIAIFGATSEIAKDLILSFASSAFHQLILFARRPEVVTQWLTTVGLHDIYGAHTFNEFKNSDHYDVIINFVGVGNPAKTAILGAGIFEITYRYDDLALQYVSLHPKCKYLFLSSGAAYCSTFEEPADENTKTNLDINHIKPQDWYGVAKLYAECRHRALSHLPLVDIRIFNYFCHTQDMSARFLITDMIRAIKNKSTLETSPHSITRDYLHPTDFHQLIELILTAPACNTAVDCYSQQPIAKLHLLEIMQKEFGLIYKVVSSNQGIVATGNKPNYFSKNKQAAHDFLYAPAYSSESGLIEQTRLSLGIQ